MENHPIPQDVTGFQFKLIGEMTIKQFAYLATGAICMWIFLSVGIPFVPKVFFAFISFLLGFSLAFIPVEGRPMDLMIGLFLKAFFIPNQYIYQKMGRQLAVALPVQHAKQPLHVPSQESAKKLSAYLSTLPKPPKNNLDEKELAFFNTLSSITPISPQPEPSTTRPQIITMEEEKKPRKENTETEAETAQELTQEAIVLQQQIQEAHKQETQQKTPTLTMAAHQRALALEKQLQEVLQEKAALEAQVLALQKTLQAAQARQGVTVRNVQKSTPRLVSVPIVPEHANLITGIIKDSRGKILPNILVEVKDKDGNPIRAFKTNALGQFAAATPLANGIYLLTFEDPSGKQKFNATEVNANGNVITPLEIISHDEREDLRRALFSSNTK